MGHQDAAQVQYYGTGGSLVLRPKFSGKITSITWKHKGNIQADWIKGSFPLEYLGDLKGRLDLNLTTGILTVNNMMKADQGLFSVEINNKVLPDAFEAQWIDNLNDHKVVVIATPLTCSSQSPSCKLRCGEEIKGAGTIQYFWKKGENGSWEQGERLIEIENTDETRRFKTFTCRAMNQISDKESKPEENPFILIERVLFFKIVIKSVALLFLLIFMVWFFWKNWNVLCRCGCRDREKDDL
ncbi:PREDICTED: uncharacterized protein LOC107097164 [Cyprinodon variegatus]|uniref:uncharacterized protein LOC107097164 n=1 Tax=Cyprinodon variegatus TaxID=28743 RepID=UPI0007426FBB|nr:PREDICTED: uncharacterized protein LOC107097164 [Cyprinodon variegatus]